jgi:hypothetical protein
VCLGIGDHLFTKIFRVLYGVSIDTDIDMRRVVAWHC